MSRRTRTLLWIVFGLLIVVGVPVAAAWYRHGAGQGGCALDGTPVDAAYRVEVMDATGQAHVFCCLTCARLWLKQQSEPPRTVLVTDEVSGQALDAAAAWYVRSTVVTRPTTGNRIHVFKDRADAEKHAEEFAGEVLPQGEDPLR